MVSVMVYSDDVYSDGIHPTPGAPGGQEFQAAFCFFPPSMRLGCPGLGSSSTDDLYSVRSFISCSRCGRQVVRTEQDYSGRWNDSWRVTYQWDSMERQDNEEREDWSGSSWDSEYEILQQYDKNGNRTLFRQTTYGSAADYGPSTQLSYTYDDVNALT